MGSVVWSVVCVAFYFAALVALRLGLDAGGRYAADWGLMIGLWFLPVCIIGAIFCQCLESIDSHSGRVWASIASMGIGLAIGNILGHGCALGGLGSALRVATYRRSDSVAWSAAISLGYGLSVYGLHNMKYGDHSVVQGANVWFLAMPLALLYGAPTCVIPTMRVFDYARQALLWLVSSGDRPDR